MSIVNARIFLFCLVASDRRHWTGARTNILWWFVFSLYFISQERERETGRRERKRERGDRDMRLCSSSSSSLARRTDQYLYIGRHSDASHSSNASDRRVLVARVSLGWALASKKYLTSQLHLSMCDSFLRWFIHWLNLHRIHPRVYWHTTLFRFKSK